MSIAIVSAAGGEIVSAGPMRIRLLEDGRHTQHRLGVVEVTIPPHVDGPPQHIHHGHEETSFPRSCYAPSPRTSTSTTSASSTHSARGRPGLDHRAVAEVMARYATEVVKPAP
jgi:hypothetical protein